MTTQLTLFTDNPGHTIVPRHGIDLYDYMKNLRYDDALKIKCDSQEEVEIVKQAVVSFKSLYYEYKVDPENELIIYLFRGKADFFKPKCMRFISDYPERAQIDLSTATVNA